MTVSGGEFGWGGSRSGAFSGPMPAIFREAMCAREAARHGLTPPLRYAAVGGLGSPGFLKPCPYSYLSARGSAANVGGGAWTETGLGLLIGACFKPCTTTHVRRAASRAQITASGMTGPGGPHRRASVARGHDAVLSLLLPTFRVRLARGTGFPNRHRSRTCGPPGTYGADTGQPRESTVQTLRSAVMRRVAAGGKLECVFPR